jgi:hypothetical protein
MVWFLPLSVLLALSFYLVVLRADRATRTRVFSTISSGDRIFVVTLGVIWISAFICEFIYRISSSADHGVPPVVAPTIYATVAYCLRGVHFRWIRPLRVSSPQHTTDAAPSERGTKRDYSRLYLQFSLRSLCILLTASALALSLVHWDVVIALGTLLLVLALFLVLTGWRTRLELILLAGLTAVTAFYCLTSQCHSRNLGPAGGFGYPACWIELSSGHVNWKELYLDLMIVLCVAALFQRFVVFFALRLSRQPE